MMSWQRQFLTVRKVFFIFVFVVAKCGQGSNCEAEVGRDAKGDYVPLNSLTITSLYKNEPTSTYKPWWADLQQVQSLTFHQALPTVVVGNEQPVANLINNLHS